MTNYFQRSYKFTFIYCINIFTQSSKLNNFNEGVGAAKS